MMGWEPIERMDTENPIWVLKYDMFWYPKGHEMEGNSCPNDYPGAQKFTSCHGYYTSEADAMAALRHFSAPNGYRMEKVYRRVLI